MKDKSYIDQDDTGCFAASEPALATANAVDVPMPDDIAYAHIVDGVLQITPDIEAEIVEVERGEVVTMNEFKTQFTKWLD